MAGRGPAPKDPDTRARTNKDPVGLRVVQFVPASPSDLPDDLLPDGEVWHPATLRWWQRWVDSPLSADLSEVDWSELEATALLHHEFMRKRSFTLAGELRLRVAKFGATPEDRARLRIVFAQAEEAETPSVKPHTASQRYRRQGLRPTGVS